MEMKSIMCTVYRPRSRARKLFCDSRWVPKDHPSLYAIAHSVGLGYKCKMSELEGNAEPFSISSGITVDNTQNSHESSVGQTSDPGLKLDAILKKKVKTDRSTFIGKS